MVSDQNGTLFCAFGAARTTLEDWHYDTFRSAPVSPPFGRVLLHFQVDAAGRAASVEMDTGMGPITFRRVAPQAGIALR